jgi:hypothetical protein
LRIAGRFVIIGKGYGHKSSDRGCCQENESMSLTEALRRPRNVKIVLTIKAPSGLVSPYEVSACLKELINDLGKPASSKGLNSSGLIPACYEGYECLVAEPYAEPVAPTQARPLLPVLAPVPSVVGFPKPLAAGGPHGVRGKSWEKLWKPVWFVCSALITLIIEHMGVPVLHWLLSTLVKYI